MIHALVAEPPSVETRLARAERTAHRERTARLEAERIAEHGLRTLYDSKQRLQLLQHITGVANRARTIPEALAAALEAICERIDVVRDERLEGLAHPFGATLRVRTGGNVLERHVADPSGEPDTFPDAAAVRKKFLGLAEPVLAADAPRLADLFETLSERPALGAALRSPA